MRPIRVLVPVLLLAAAPGAAAQERDWWDEAWSREEWDVTLGSGGLYRLFHDRLADDWYVEGALD